VREGSEKKYIYIKKENAKDPPLIPLHHPLFLKKIDFY
jgi:hypothetical protein